MKLYYGNSIKIYRITNKLSQEELAEKINISKSMLGMLENNKRNASNEIEIRIKELIGISLDKELQEKMLNDFEKYLLEYFKNYEIKNGNDMLNNFLNDIVISINDVAKMQHLYYGRLVDYKDFIEISQLSSFRNFLLYEETEEYYKKANALKQFYKTYTEFILDNLDNIIEIIQNFILRNEQVNYITIFKDKLPPNIKSDFTKIIKSIDSTTYADYNIYRMNPNFIGKCFGIYVIDDSMNPKYEIGNIAIVNINDELDNNKDYLIRIKKDFIIRRIQIENEQIILKPLNYNYNIRTCTKENMKELDIEIIGKIIDIKIN